MIVVNQQEQWVGCTVCEERIELRRKTLANTETMLLIREHLTAEHNACEQNKANPARAKRDREFSRRVREELARIERASAKLELRAYLESR